jgi:hypothetical protein
MTMARAAELRSAVHAALRAILDRQRYEAIFVRAGADYRAALGDIAALAPPGVTIACASGGQGQKNAALKAWLYDLNAPTSSRHTRSTRPAASSGIADYAAEQALEIARQALARRDPEVSRYSAWYVPVDGERVGAKWLAGQLTGRPLNAFNTTQARQWLQQIGIEVRRE